jgi:hypothetical protein
MNKIIHYTQGHSKYDKHPKQHDDDIIEFYKSFKKPKIISDKAKSQVFNLNYYGTKVNSNGGHRFTGNILQISGIILDIDNKDDTNISIDETIEQLSAFNFYLYTSYNHRPNNPRFRVFLPFIEPVSPEYFLGSFDYFDEILNGSIDKATRQVNQIYHVPCCSRKNYKYFHSHINDKSEYFNPIATNIKRKENSIIRKNGIKKAVNITPNITIKQKYVDLTKLNIEPNIKELIITGDISDYPSRSEALMAIISVLIKADLSNNAIASILVYKKNRICKRILEKGEKAIFQDIGRIRGKVDKKANRIYPVEPPHYPPKSYFSTDDAIKFLNELTSTAFETPKDQRAIKSSAGVGKTEAFIDGIGLTDLYIEYYVPTHELANDVLKRIKNRYPFLQVQIIQGRDKDKESGRSLCKKSDIIQKMSGNNLSIYRQLCHNEEEKCRHYDTCQYIKQFQKDVQVRIFTHAHLKLSRTILDNKLPSLAVIDESFYDKLLETTKIPARTFTRLLDNNMFSKAVIKALKTGQPLLKYLRNKFKSKLDSLLEESLITVKNKIVYPDITPIMSEKKANKQLNFDNTYLNKAVLFLETINTELNLFKKRSDSFTTRLIDKNIEVYTRKDITRFKYKEIENDEEIEKSVPILCIDADHSKQINRVFFPEIKQKIIHVKRNAQIIQVVTTRNSNSRFYRLDDGTKNHHHIKQANTILKRLTNNEKTLIIGPGKIVGNKNQKRKPLLDLPSNAKFEHFGNLRGIDGYKNYNNTIIIGRLQYPTHVLEAMAASLWWDSGYKLKLNQELIPEVRGYRHSHIQQGVEVMVHPDKRVQHLQEKLRESEILQGIDRLRLIYNNKPKTVYILTNLVLDIDVNHFVTWKELYKGGEPVVKAFARNKCGVMPLNNELLSKKYPKLFKTKDTTKELIRTFKGQVKKEILMHTSRVGVGGWDPEFISGVFYIVLLYTNCHLLKYRIVNTKGRDRTALIRSGITPEQAKRHLERIYGAKIRFKPFKL